MGKPAFDLILGTKTLKELGIILNFKKQMITINEIELPMQNLKDKKALALNNSLAKSKEPKSNEEATQCLCKSWVPIVKAHLQGVVTDNCAHLVSSKEQISY